MSKSGLHDYLCKDLCDYGSIRFIPFFRRSAVGVYIMKFLPYSRFEHMNESHCFNLYTVARNL